MKVLFLLIASSLYLSASAQHAKVLEIRDYYKEVKANIAANNPDSISFYYSDQIIRNRYDAQWRAIGIFHDTITYWYGDAMEAANMDGNMNQDSSWALTLVTISSQYSTMLQYREWLFLDGKLIFHFDKLDGSEYNPDSNWEYRYYFDNNKLIRFMSGGEIIGNDDDPASIISSGEEMKTMFRSIIRN